MKLTRRSVLASGAGAVGAGALSGCLDDPGALGGSDGGYAAFFALWDWASEIAGDAMSFENPVSTGEMGHGWEPDGNLAPEIATSEVFIYLDTPEFAWAQDIAADLERDYADEVTVIDGLSGLGPYLLPFDGGTDGLPEPDHDREIDPDDVSRDRFDHYDLRSNDQLGYWHVDHWHGGVPDVPLDGGGVPIGAVFRDNDENVVPLGLERPFQFDARLADDAPDDVVEITSRGDHVELTGLETGETAVVFQLRHQGDLVYETDEDPMDVTVVAEIDEGVSEFHDPHVWADPVLSQRVVETIADGLAEVDPENADLFAENAAAYVERLEGVHQQYEELVANAERDVAVFAAHDSFQYVEDRYGFELHTPVGVSPDAAESLEDVSSLVDVVEAHDIDTILYDPFETPHDDSLPSAARLLLDNSSATDAEPLTPAEGTTHEWADNEWGWVDQMENVTIPSLEKALGAT